MEVLLVLLLATLALVVALAAKRGAEAARRARERRWTQVPTRPLEVNSAPAGNEATATTTPMVHPGGGAAPPVAAAGAALRPAGPSGGASGAAARPVRPSTAVSTQPPEAVAPPTRLPPRPIDINRASVEELKSLPGVGVRAAERIVAHRDRHGGFASVSELEAVEGFDTHRVSRLAPRATVATGEPSGG